MPTNILPPTDRDPAWKGFGGLPENWNTGNVPEDAVRTPAPGELLHAGASARADLPEGMRLLKEPPSMAALVHPFLAPVLDAPTSAAALEVADGTVCDEPLLLSTVFAAGQGRAVPSTEIRVGANARCSIDERVGFLGPDIARHLTSSTVLRIGAGATVTWRTTVHAPEGLLALLHRQVVLGPGATVHLDLEVAGQGRVRVASTQVLEGEGASATMASAFRLEQDARAAHHVLQEVAAARGTTRYTERVVADDRAASAFVGTIHLTPAAQGADSTQSHRALLLSDHAASAATPSLEIEADDVRCSHGATTARLDDDQRFYLLSRGIPEDEATRMLVEAFLTEAGMTPLSPVPVPAAT